MKKIKGFKGFNKGLKCRDFQYEENTEYEISDDPKLCNKGFHFCENPLDILDYYNICDSEFAEVEAIGKTKSNNQKSVTNKIKIGFKIDLKSFIKASFDFIWEKCKITDEESKLASSGYSSQLASTGHSSQLASSGHSSQLASSGDYSQLASSGYSSQLASTGDSSQLASSGHSSKLASSGHYSKLASTGHSSQLALTGSDSVGANIGIRGKIKASKGCWITLAEYGCNNKILCVKSAKVTNGKIKADTWYRLINGKFTEVK